MADFKQSLNDTEIKRRGDFAVTRNKQFVLVKDLYKNVPTNWSNA